MKADPAGAAARGVVSESPAGYVAMVCVYLYGFIYYTTWQGMSSSIDRTNPFLSQLGSVSNEV